MLDVGAVSEGAEARGGERVSGVLLSCPHVSLVSHDGIYWFDLYFLTSCPARTDAPRHESAPTFTAACSCLGRSLIRTWVCLRTEKGCCYSWETAPPLRRQSCRAERRDHSDGCRGWRGGQRMPVCPPFALSLSLPPSALLGHQLGSILYFWATVLTGKAVLMYACSRTLGSEQPGSSHPRTACSSRRVGRSQSSPERDCGQLVRPLHKLEYCCSGPKEGGGSNNRAASYGGRQSCSCRRPKQTPAEFHVSGVCCSRRFRADPRAFGKNLAHISPLKRFGFLSKRKWQHRL